jgi:hypothetical protein
MSVSNPRRTCSEDSKSSIFPILAWNNNLFYLDPADSVKKG